MNKEILSGEEVPLSACQAFVRSIGLSLLFWAFAVALCFFLYSCEAKSADVFLDGGVAKWDQTHCKVWQNECGGYQTTWDEKTTYVRLGGEFGLSKHFSTRLSAFDLGKNHIDGDTSPSEPCLDIYGTSAVYYCGTADRYHTVHHIYGTALTLKLHTDQHYDFSGFLEAGPTYVRQSMKLVQDNWAGHTLDQHGWGFGYMVSVGVRYKSLGLSAFRYDQNITPKGSNAELFGTRAINGVAVSVIGKF